MGFLTHLFVRDFILNTFFIGKGILMTMQLLMGAFIISIVLGLLASIIRYKGIATFLINRIISLLRGMPLLLQLAFVYFAVPATIGIQLNILTAGIIAFGLNSSAYIAEILRSGIESIPKGQFEASQTLNISPFKMWKDIILPQVVHNIMPAILNEVITLLKNTALIATIGGMDIMRSAQTVAAEQFTYFIPLCIAGFYYYILVIFIEYLGKIYQKKLHYA